MDTDGHKLFKICVSLPEEFLERMMDPINDNMESVYPGYDRAFMYSRVKGTWRPLNGSKPFKGKINEIETVDEIKLEFLVAEKDLKNVLKVIKEIHPYEEPAIDVTSVRDWKEII
jgi:hypothetical protein